MLREKKFNFRTFIRNFKETLNKLKTNFQFYYKVLQFYILKITLISLKWVENVRRFSKGLPYIIVATKGDLREDEVNILRLKRLKNQKPVSREEGQAMAKRVGAIAYHEVSAKFPVSFSNFLFFFYSIHQLPGNIPTRHS